MLPVGTSTPASIAVAALTVFVLFVLVWSCRRPGRDGPDDSDPGPDDGGGGGGRRRPRRPPPAGPVSWAEFERQFAAYVASREGGSCERAVRPRDRMAA
jgi:hypothetical protein